MQKDESQTVSRFRISFWAILISFDKIKNIEFFDEKTVVKVHHIKAHTPY